MDELLKDLAKRYDKAEQSETKEELDNAVCLMYRHDVITHEQYMTWASLTWDRKE